MLAGCPTLTPARSTVDNVGVNIRYRHLWVTPLNALYGFFAGGDTGWTFVAAQHLPHGADAMIRRRRADDRRQRGQGLVEFALVLPIFAVLVVSIGELGLIYGKISSLGYASREGARVGSALALGDDIAVQSLQPGSLHGGRQPRGSGAAHPASRPTRASP